MLKQHHTQKRQRTWKLSRCPCENCFESLTQSILASETLPTLNLQCSVSITNYFPLPRSSKLHPRHPPKKKTGVSFLVFLFFFFCNDTWLEGSQFSEQGLNLTTRSSRNSLTNEKFYVTMWVCVCGSWISGLLLKLIYNTWKKVNL